MDLRLIKDELAELTVSNTTGGNPELEGTGLGSKLIDAFARQLNGQVHVENVDATYTLTVKFHVPTTAKQVYDY